MSISRSTSLRPAVTNVALPLWAARRSSVPRTYWTWRSTRRACRLVAYGPAAVAERFAAGTSDVRNATLACTMTTDAAAAIAVRALSPEVAFHGAMPLDFGALPPEINSARIYSGPGSAPLLAAAGAWDGLAAELGIAATGYRAAISDLTGMRWVGPTAASMIAAVTPYMEWLSETALRAEQAGIQAKAAAAAYETAFALTVPPPVIAANRALLAALIATNFFGQNTPAIAATEAQYAEFWAQDAAAMYGYANTSAAATVLTAFKAPPNTTNPAGWAGQETAVTEAGALAAGTAQHTVASPAAQGTSLTGILQQFGSTTLGGIESKLSGLTAALNTFPTENLNLTVNSYGLSYFGAGVVQLGYLFSQQLIPHFGKAPLVPAIEPALASNTSSAGGRAAFVSANVGRAGRVGLMSVPSSWATPPSPPPSLLSPATSGTAVSFTHGAPASSMQSMIPGLPSDRRGATFGRRRYGIRLTVMAHPPDAL